MDGERNNMMEKVSRWNICKELIHNESGTETVEWAIIAGLLFVGIITVVTAIGVWLSDTFTGLKTEMGA